MSNESVLNHATPSCPHCQAAITAGAKFCDACGTPLGADSTLSAKDKPASSSKKRGIKFWLGMIAVVVLVMFGIIVSVLVIVTIATWDTSNFSETCNLNGYGRAECQFHNKGGTKGSDCVFFSLKPKNRFNKIYLDSHYSMEKSKKKLKEALSRDKYRVTTENLDYAHISSVLNRENYVVSNQEICSGIVEPNDIRKSSFGSMTFNNLSPDEICATETATWKNNCEWEIYPKKQLIKDINEEIKKQQK